MPKCNHNKILRDAILCLVETEALTSLSAKAASRFHQAFLPKTHGAYTSIFKIFVALYIFHDFGLSGATFAHASHIPIQDIKHHGTWSSDCVWRYIYSDHASGENLAFTLASTINAM